jgi:hypothetical protein
MTLPSLPVWWELDGTTWNNGPDAAGNRLIVRSSRGWTGSAPPRPDIQPRPTSSGGYRGPNYRAPRVVELVGLAEAPSAIARELLADQLAGLCLDPDTLYPLTRHEHGRTLTLWVELADKTSVIERRDGSTLDVSLQLIAPDPLKYTADNPAVSTGLASAAASGMAWNGSPGVTGGAEWNGSPTVTGGVQWQDAVGSGGVLLLTNTGTAPAPITFTITPAGSVTNPTITNKTTSQRITYGGLLTASLQINTGTGSTVIGNTNVRGALTESEFFMVPARSSLEVLFTATGGDAQLLAVNANAFS